MEINYTLPKIYTGKVTLPKYIKFLKLKVKGTVFSGHPSRTTWGNTYRII